MTWIDGRWIDTPQYGSEVGYNPDEQEDTMTYVPKHRGEPKTVYRAHYIESECGWGRDEWDRDFDTEVEAREAVAECNARNTSVHAPDYYIIANYVGPVEL